MVEGRGGRSHVVNEIQEHTDGVPPSCVSRPGCSSTSFQSESHPAPRGPTDPPGSIIKRHNREQTDNTAALRQRLKRSGQRSAISPLPHNRDQGPLNRSRCLCPRTQRTNRRRDRRRSRNHKNTSSPLSVVHDGGPPQECGQHWDMDIPCAPSSRRQVNL